jgi:N-acetylglucosamine kinase-like BadF-type ATPase
MASLVQKSRLPEGYVCVGVDAGASGTSAVLTDICGTMLVPARFGPPANPNTVPLAASVAGVAALVADLWRDLVASTDMEGGEAAFLQPGSLAITVALSGGDTPEGCGRYRDALRERLEVLDCDARAGCANCRSCPDCACGLSSHYALTVVHDSLAPIALALPPCSFDLAHGSWPGDSEHEIYASVVAGTGSVAVCARPKCDGTLEVLSRRGGWGQLLSDEGSAYHIAVCLTRSCFRLYDLFHSGSSGRARRNPPGCTDASVVLHALCIYHDVKVGNLPELAAKISDATTSKAEIAGFAKHIAVLAEGGNQLCYQALHDAGKELGNLLLDALRIDIPPASEKAAMLSSRSIVRACLVGGVFASWQYGVKNGFMSAMKRTPVPLHLLVIQSDYGAALGGARMGALVHLRLRARRAQFDLSTDGRSPADDSGRSSEVATWDADLGDTESYVLHPFK